MINIPEDKLPLFIKTVYDMSVPVGMGMLHYQKGSLTDDEIASLIYPTGSIAVSMDYVKGRQCKMTVHRKEDGLFIKDYWPDHTEDQLVELLNTIGVTQPT